MRQKLRLLATFAGVAITFAIVAAAGADVSIKVFVGAPTRGGFVDTGKDVEDSIKDLKKRLKGAKGVALVESREGADVSVMIVARGVGNEHWGDRLVYQDYYRGAELINMPIALTTWWVAAVLDVEAVSYRKEFVGTYTHPPGLAYYGGAWSDCASALAKNVKTWIEANRERLKATKNGAR